MNAYLKAIKAKCIDCCGGERKEVELCTVKNCPLYEFRIGKVTKKRNMSDEQRAAAGERLKKAREAKIKTISE